MIVSVAGGKGGVGKTTVVLALALGAPRARIAECNLDSPACKWLLKAETAELVAVDTMIPLIDRKVCNACGVCVQACRFGALLVSNGMLHFFPERCHSCGACYMSCKKRAVCPAPLQIGTVLAGSGTGDYGHVRLYYGRVSVAGASRTAVIREIKRELRDCEYSLVDSPAVPSPAMAAAVADSDACLLVTEPSAIAVRELERNLSVLDKMRFFRRGIVVNKSENGRWQAEIRELGFRYDAPVLAHIPFHHEWATAYAKGALPAMAKAVGRHLWEEIRLTWPQK